MFGANVTGSTLSFAKILGGIFRTLSIANQAIPLYKEIKPMIGNARKVMEVLKEFNTTRKNDVNPINNKNTINAVIKKEVTNNATSIGSSNPVFFQ